MKKHLLALATLVAVTFAHADKAKTTGGRAAPAEAVEAPAPTEKFDFAKIFKDKLVDADGKKADAAKFGKAKYKLVYFSASWCGPCRRFTPELVKFVNDNRKGDNLEVVLIGLDKNREAMVAYMKGDNMPWPGVLESDLGAQRFSLGVTGIPHVRVFDSGGRLIMDGNRMGRAELLVALKAKLDARSGSKK